MLSVLALLVQEALLWVDGELNMAKETNKERDAYRKDSSYKGTNHRDKGSPAKKISTASMKSKDKQC